MRHPVLTLYIKITNVFLAPMAKTKDGNYFLDANPRYFQEILDYLRFGEIFTEDKAVLKGVKSLANYFGLLELVRKIEFESQWIILVFKIGPAGKEEFKILLKNITRFKNSTLAKYFLGDEAAVQSLSQWIRKEGENYYFIDRELKIWTRMIEFMKQDQGEGLKQRDNYGDSTDHLINELNFFGFQDYYHHLDGSKIIRWNKI